MKKHALNNIGKIIILTKYFNILGVISIGCVYINGMECYVKISKRSVKNFRRLHVMYKRTFTFLFIQIYSIQIYPILTCPVPFLIRNGVYHVIAPSSSILINLFEYLLNMTTWMKGHFELIHITIFVLYKGAKKFIGN